LRLADSFGMRSGLTKRVVSPSTRRSSVVRFGARCRERLLISQELMLEQERLSCDPAPAARAEEFREGNEQMDRQEEHIAHELKIITPANLHKTAP
jgi:hypothetical protein